MYFLCEYFHWAEYMLHIGQLLFVILYIKNVMYTSLWAWHSLNDAYAKAIIMLKVKNSK